jgi:hypothetical protein
MTASRVPDRRNARSALEQHGAGAPTVSSAGRGRHGTGAVRLHAPFASMAGSPPGTVRIGPILALPAVLSELDVAPRRVFARAGVPLASFRDSESRISYEALGRLLSACATLARCEHFGLLASDRLTLNGLGAVGYLIRSSATVGQALRALVLHLHRYDRIAVPVLVRPEPSKDVAPFRRVFGAKVPFEAELSGVVFPAAWLDHRTEGADPQLHALRAGTPPAEGHAPAAGGDRRGAELRGSGSVLAGLPDLGRREPEAMAGPP